MASGILSPRKVAASKLRTNLIDSITDRFFLLASRPYLGRTRDDDLGKGSRSFNVGEYVIVYCVQNERVLILRVVHGRRDLEALFGGVNS
jgi:toxin ParE1/3/4